jgi:hypothetical protein
MQRGSASITGRRSAHHSDIAIWRDYFAEARRPLTSGLNVDTARGRGGKAVSLIEAGIAAVRESQNALVVGADVDDTEVPEGTPPVRYTLCCNRSPSVVTAASPRASADRALRSGDPTAAVRHPHRPNYLSLQRPSDSSSGSPRCSHFRQCATEHQGYASARGRVARTPPAAEPAESRTTAVLGKSADSPRVPTWRQLGYCAWAHRFWIASSHTRQCACFGTPSYWYFTTW